MNKNPVTAFSTAIGKTGLLEIPHELADFSRHLSSRAGPNRRHFHHAENGLYMLLIIAKIR
jgi:hypothetical protein